MLLAGLGNPGPAYRHSRHNVGFRVADRFARRVGVSRLQTRWHGIAGTAVVGGRTVTVLKPLTYMNLSGLSVRAALQELRLGPGDLIVAHDDLDLDLGRIRIRPGGSSGGHRGVQSIVDELGTEEFGRLRLGIGRPPAGTDPAEFVLGAFTHLEEAVMEDCVSRAVEAAVLIVCDGYAPAMARYNG
ncbi:MAG: aminoacyl-tRNA hydrolase [Firmicutes bacterium]|jgi:PTH1 family peptidyl-tRNA hydrolase|nr:aminoacyl-tRNA hydrolase [Bacillota bacterium]